MPKTSDYDKTHLRNLALIATRIDRIFKTATEEAAKIGATITTPLREDKIFNFNDYPRTHQHIERLLSKLQESVETIIVNGVRSAWTLSNNKNNALSARVFGEQLSKLTKEQQRRYFSTNAQALESFLQRKAQGLNLSDRVWKYTDAFKHEIELALDLGIRSGESAAQMTRSLRQYLQHPEQLFRRVRDRHGLLQLSRAAQEFHPGTGVYRSSYKNARRLAATETNIAYRTSDHLRWQQMDFVVGIEIQLSNNHTVLLQPGERTSDPSQQRRDGSPKANAVRPLTDICDTLAGRYPKDFKFTGWHPHCRCRAISILKTDEELAADTERMLRGQEPTNASVNTVRDVPAAFKDWVKERSEKIETARNLPYFIRDNQKRVDRILGKVEEVKKSPLEIAKERHDARTPESVEKIKRRWSTRQMNSLWQALGEGELTTATELVLTRLSEMLAQGKYTEFYQKAQPLISAAARHRNRTIGEASRIQKAWDANRGKGLYEREFEALEKFKTRSKDYKWYLSQAQIAYEKGEYANVKHYIDAAKYVKKRAEQNAAEKMAEKAAIVYKEPTPKEYAAAMKRNKSLGVFTTEQDANNRALEIAMGVKQGEIMDWRTADSNNSNPGYKRKTAAADGYVDNCQTCTMTYEARRRGFKITAAPSPGKMYVHPDNFYTFAKDKGISWRDRFINSDGTTPTPVTSRRASIDDTIEAKTKFINDNTTIEGRYEVYCAWKGKDAGAHVFIVEREQSGELLWIDPQTGKSGDSIRMYTKSMKPDVIEILRIDDKIINPKFASRMVKKTK